MIVYRYQNEKGEGPYRGQRICWGIWRDPARHPTPDADFEALRLNRDAVDYFGDLDALTDLVRPYRFGFPSIEAAYAWFRSDERDTLRADGFQLHAIPAREVIVSDSGKQCMFRE